MYEYIYIYIHIHELISCSPAVCNSYLFYRALCIKHRALFIKHRALFIQHRALSDDSEMYSDTQRAAQQFASHIWCIGLFV